jgi:hypothetical protein
VAVLVVGGALLRVGEDLVGFLGLLELLLRLGVVRIAVRMVLHGQLAVGLLDLVVRSVAVDAEDFVVVALFAMSDHSRAITCKGRIEGRVVCGPSNPAS